MGFRVHCECAQQNIVPEIPTRNERDKSNKCATATSPMTSGFLGARIYSSGSNIYEFHPAKLICVLWKRIKLSLPMSDLLNALGIIFQLR